MKKTCKNCKHWKNKQRELNYWDDNGFCVNPELAFDTQDGRLAGVFDTENHKGKHVDGNPSHDFESRESCQVKQSRYLLTTNAEFGCNKFEAK